MQAFGHFIDSQHDVIPWDCNGAICLLAIGLGQDCIMSMDTHFLLDRYPNLCYDICWDMSINSRQTWHSRNFRIPACNFHF